MGKIGVTSPIADRFILVNYTPRPEANPMRVSLFAMFVYLATFACVIMSTQAPMTAQSEQVPQTEAEYWLLLRKSLHTFLTTLCRVRNYRKLGHAHMQTTEIYTRADPSVKLEALESVMPPKLRSGRFKATDKLIESLKSFSVMQRKNRSK